jgi:hypothetical protein
MQPEELEPIGTLPGVASINGVYADYNCCEEDGQHHRKHKGESLDGVEGWATDDEEVAL